MEDANQYHLDQLDNELRHIDRFPIFFADFLRDYVEKYKINISDENIKAAIGSMSDVIDDMCFDRRAEIATDIASIDRPSYSEILFQALKPLPNQSWGKFRPSVRLVDDGECA